MPRSQNIDLEAERQTLIGMIKEADLSESLVRKLRTNLTLKKVDHPAMPTAMAVEQLSARLKQDMERPSDGITTDEFLKEMALW